FLIGLFCVALVIYEITTPSTKEIQLTGIITGTDAIVSPLVQGRLQKLLVDEGSEVKVGQLIAEIDPTELKDVRESATDNIRTLEARLLQANTTLAMNERQTTAAVQQAEASLTATRAQLAQASAQRDQADTQLGYTKIVSPINGIVSVRVARQGEVVQPGGPVVTVLDVDHLWVQADVEETYVDQIAFGQKLQVRLPSGKTIEGTVFFKGVESDFATQRDVSRTKRDI